MKRSQEHPLNVESAVIQPVTGKDDMIITTETLANQHAYSRLIKLFGVEYPNGLNTANWTLVDQLRLLRGSPLKCHWGWLVVKGLLPRRSMAGIDIVGTDLMGADLRGANLQCTNLRRTCMKNVNLTGADLRGADLRDADLRNADLTYANLRGADLEDADLGGADLTDANLEGAIGLE